MNDTAAITAYEQLLELIFKKQLLQGEKISENALVQKLNISRTPIRQALIHLENDGLVEVCPKCYTRIAKYSNEYRKKIGIIRVGLDIMAVNLAILNGSNADFAILENINTAYIEAVERNDIEQKIILDCNFHMEIAKISKNEILIKFQQEMYLKVRFILTYADFDALDKMRSAKMHQKILDTLKKRDPQNAIKYVKQHLYEFYDLNDELTNIF